MKRHIRSLVTALAVASASAITSASAMAEESQVTDCGPDGAMVHVQGMGMVTREHLQEHLDKMQDQLKWAKRTEAHTSQRRKALELHHDQMQTALTQLDAGIATRPCATNLSPDARIQILEQRVDALQKVVEQLTNHQSEAERP